MSSLSAASASPWFDPFAPPRTRGRHARAVPGRFGASFAGAECCLVFQPSPPDSIDTAGVYLEHTRSAERRSPRFLRPHPLKIQSDLPSTGSPASHPVLQPGQADPVRNSRTFNNCSALDRRLLPEARNWPAVPPDSGAGRRCRPPAVFDNRTGSTLDLYPSAGSGRHTRRAPGGRSPRLRWQLTASERWPRAPRRVTRRANRLIIRRLPFSTCFVENTPRVTPLCRGGRAAGRA